MKKILLLLLPAVVIASCKHSEYEEPTLGAPAFSIRGLRNGIPFSLAAGDNGLTQVSQLERNKFGVMEWSSSFIQAGCSSCEPVFKLIINDAEGINYEDCEESDLFNAASLQFAGVLSNSPFSTCSFDIELPICEENVDADYLIDGNEINGSSVTLNAGKYLVKADFEIGNAQESEVWIHQTIYAGSHHKLSAPFRYEILGINDNSMQIRAEFPNLNPSLRPISWETEDGEFFDEEVNLNLGEEGFIQVNYVNDILGDTGIYKIRWENGTLAFLAEDDEEGFSNNTAPYIQFDWETSSPNYEKVFIEFTHNGKKYTSVNPFNENAEFILESFNDYIGDGNNSINKKLSANFDLRLFEEGNPADYIELTDCRGQFGFVVPR